MLLTVLEEAWWHGEFFPAVALRNIRLFVRVRKALRSHAYQRLFCRFFCHIKRDVAIQISCSIDAVRRSVGFGWSNFVMETSASSLRLCEDTTTLTLCCLGRGLSPDRKFVAGCYQNKKG